MAVAERARKMLEAGELGRGISDALAHIRCDQQE